MGRFLAHQGGWDELLWFAVPVVLAVVWVRWAEGRARARQAKGPTKAGEAGTNMPDEPQS